MKMEYVNLLGGCCQMCGDRHPYYLYDFHHTDPQNKKFSWGTMKKMSSKKRMLELSKCILLCANCHAILHLRASDGEFSENIASKKTRERKNTRKSMFIERAGGTCRDCGRVFDFRIYEFHHIDPKSKTGGIIGRNHSLSSEETEIEKCVLLCRNCHRTRHYSNEVNGVGFGPTMLNT